MRAWRIALVALVMLLSLAGVVQAQEREEGKLVLGGTYTLGAGDNLFGDLVVLGGTATLEAGSTVYGNVVVLGGALSIGGTVTRDVSVLGGTVRLAPTALVGGQLTSLGGAVDRAAEAQIKGGVTEGPDWGWQWDEWPMAPTMPWGRVSHTTSGFWGVLRQIAEGVLTMLGLIALGVLVILLLPEQTEQIAQVVRTNAGISLAMGILSLVVIPILLVLLVITCIGPVILALAAGIALLFGWIAIGLVLGRLILTGLRAKETSPLVAVILGVGLISFLSQIPCIGWLFALVVASLGLGAVILTRFGTMASPAPLSATRDASGEPTAPYGTE